MQEKTNNKQSDIATPDTEDELDKQVMDILNRRAQNAMLRVGSPDKEATKELRHLIRTEKLKVLEQVKLEKPESAGGNDFQNGVYSGYLNAIDDINAIREKLRNNI